MLRRAARKAVRVALSRPRVRRLVDAELERQRRAAAPEPVRLPVTFVDRRGTPHPLDPAHRDRLKPAWRTMLDPVAAAAPPTDKAVKDRTRRARRLATEAGTVLETTAGTGFGGRILEVGCYDGAIAYELSRIDGTSVVASDLARYYVVQRPGDPTDAEVAAQQTSLATLRERTRAAAGTAPDAVTFIEDDFTMSALEPGAFDAIVSFEVLEHLLDLRGAFAAMHRLLKPGGIGYHDYNPFFSVNGGHSLCTLDFPYGHARLDASDFERYVEALRPTAAAQTLRFYRESLNRVTLADLRAGIVAAGLETIALLPWRDRALIPQAGAALADVRRAYPMATLDDLLATFVTVIVRRPA